MIRSDISALRKKYKTLSRKLALARIDKVILDWETELIYFETSDLKKLKWLREQTKEEYDEYLKPILKNKSPKYFHNDEPDTPLTKRLGLEGRYNQLKRNIAAFKNFREEIENEWPSNESVRESSIEVNLNKDHPINELFKAGALVGLLLILDKGNLITIDQKSYPWQFTFTGDGSNKAQMLGALFTYLVKSQLPFLIERNIPATQARIKFTDFFHCSATYDQFKKHNTGKKSHTQPLTLQFTKPY